MMPVNATCYYQGKCNESPKYEVWLEDSEGTLVYSHLCEPHYSELVENGRNFDYVFDLDL